MPNTRIEHTQNGRVVKIQNVSDSITAASWIAMGTSSAGDQVGNDAN